MLYLHDFQEDGISAFLRCKGKKHENEYNVSVGIETIPPEREEFPDRRILEALWSPETVGMSISTLTLALDAAEPNVS